MKQPYNTTIYNTALYLRLSRDDENFGDSVSIDTQRTILQQFAREQGLHVVGEYVDDGWSGTNFERPNFQRMMDDVEAGKVNCIVTKDDCVIKARTPQTLENRHFLRIGTEFRAIQRPQRAAYHIETS